MTPTKPAVINPLRLRFFVATLFLLGGISPSVSAEASGKPNIILIFTDDQGWLDLGRTSDFYETPNIDALARKGMVFTDAYASAANCAPSRASLISGQYGARHHIFTVGRTDRGPKELMRVMPVPNATGLSAAQVTMAEALKAAGYATGTFGKWHLDGPAGAQASAQGFDTEFNSYHLKPQDRSQESSADPKGMFSLTAAAGKFIEENMTKPFLVYLAHHAAHGALESRPETRRRFMAKNPGRLHRDALYAACLYDLDEAIGQLLRQLDELKLSDNTLVVFTSDNGGVQWSPQDPLRGFKGEFYEGGIRVPMVVRWPGRIAPGTTCEVPVSNVDFYPTFLAAAGMPVPQGKVLDGESLLPLFEGRDRLQRDAVFWHFPGYLDILLPGTRDPVFRTRPVSVVRKGDWKLHLYLEEWLLDGGREKIAVNRSVELYNLTDDLREQNDLAQINPTKRDELLGDLLRWFERTGAPLPTKANPQYAPPRAKEGSGRKSQVGS